MRKLLPILFLLFTQLSLYGQVPPDTDLCHWVNAGPDQNTCGGQAVTLTATFADMKQPIPTQWAIFHTTHLTLLPGQISWWTLTIFGRV